MIIESLIIYDHINRRVNKFDFDSGINLLVSETNTLGKSCLIKSIYHTLGFSIKVWPTGWNVKNMLFKVWININGKKISITRHNDLFYINDKEQILTEKEYSIWLQNQLNIRIKIKEKKSKVLTDVYASEVLLPFYIDQDKSWNGYVFSKTSDSFGRYDNTAKNVLDFYFGLNNMKKLELVADKSKSEEKLKQHERKMEALQLLEKQHLSSSDFIYISKLENKDKISEAQLNNYFKKLKRLNSILSEYDEKIIEIEKEINRFERDLVELNKLRESYRKRFKDIEHKCIYCNSYLTEEQSLTRLKIRNSLYEIGELIANYLKKVDELKEKKDLLISKKSDFISEQNRIEKIVSSKRDIEAERYIENRVHQEIVNNYLNLEQKVQTEINTELGKINEIKKSINKEQRLGRAKRSKIRNKYNELINDYELSLGNIKLNDIEFYSFKEIKDSGNQGNKKMLAIYTLYSNLISEFSDIDLPYAMDSFIKNETARDVKEQMFKFLSKYYLTLSKQIFFSIIEENLTYLDSNLKYKKIIIEKPILEKVNKNNENLIESFSFI